MNSKTAILASVCVRNRVRSSSSHSSVAKKLSHIALFEASPTDPIQGRTFASRQRRPKAIEVYWASLVRVVNDLTRTTLPQRHLQRVENELGAQVRSELSLKSLV